MVQMIVTPELQIRLITRIKSSDMAESRPAWE
jgi:hypothetical protein